MKQTSEKANFLVQIISTNGRIRGHNLLDSLQTQKIKYSIVDGVIPDIIDFKNKKLHSPELSKLINFREIKIGEVGCSLAHKKCSTNLLNSNYQFGLVLEDDAEIVNDFNFELIKKFLSVEIPRIIILGWIPGFAIAYNSKSKNADDLFKLVTPATCTFAYALNKSAAELIVNNGSKIMDLADWPIYLFDKVEFFITNGAWTTASHDPANSTIGARSDINFSKVSQRIGHGFRVVTNSLLLYIFSIFSRLDISFKQILHRMILKDLIYKYGYSQIQNPLFSVKNTENGIVFAPKSIEMLAKFLRL